MTMARILKCVVLGLVMIALLVTITGCGKEKFTCGGCYRDKNEKPNKVNFLGESVKLCDDCYDEWKELGNLFN